MYRFYFKIAILLLSLYMMFSAKAGNVDLELQINIDISEGVEFQQTGEFRVTLINHGPDAAGEDSTVSRPNEVLTSIIQQAPSGFPDISFRRNVNIIQDCFFVEISASPPPGGLPHMDF